MFTQPCFIRRNTPELREKLEEIGYVSCCNFDSRCDAICVFERDSKPEYLDFQIDEDFEVNIKDSFPFVDAGTNEKLFLALAALRDDTDKNQWFILDSYAGSVNYPDTFHPKGSMVLCADKKWKDMPIFGNIPAHKATVEELIEHFKE